MRNFEAIAQRRIETKYLTEVGNLTKTGKILEFGELWSIPQNSVFRVVDIKDKTTQFKFGSYRDLIQG